MKALVIGYGSIGRRHTDVLEALGHDVAVVSRRAVSHPRRYSDIAAALAGFGPVYAVVASRTNEHRDDIAELARLGFSGMLLIEKPVYDQGAEAPGGAFEKIKVAFNLRFHPAMLRFRELLDGRTVRAATVYCGSYLPDWRPNTDYRAGYSAIRSEGGGVLRDLSHELDYVNWLFGPWRRVAAIGGCFGNLGIDSDDVFSMLLETKNVPSVTLGINYLDSVTRRDVLAITDTGSVRLDLVNGTVEHDGNVESFSVERNDTYTAEHTAMLAGDDSVICDIEDGLQVMRLIGAAERAAGQGEWVAA